MTPADPAELDALERQRRDADRRYNDALTAFDRAVTAAAAQPTHAQPEFGRLATTLIVFLQHITAFVDTKDRELAAHANARVDAIERTLDPIGEMRAQLAVAQRAIQMLTRQLSTQHAAPSTQHPAPSTQHSSDYVYVAFEDQFRGSAAAIADRLRAYLPLFEGRSDVLDIGSGRGEFLAALKAAGISGSGVDSNSEMAAIARDRGLAVSHDDALSYIKALGNESLGGAIATQVVEHLEPSYLMELLATLSQKLRPGAPLVVETINAACWLAFFSSYIRDLTHVRPVHPETLQYLLRAHGFERVEIRYSAPVPEQVRMQAVALPADVDASPDPSALALRQIAHTINANAAILNNLMFTHLDYAAIGYRT